MRRNLYLILLLTIAFTAGVKAQTVSGTVSNDTEPLSGANIKIEGKRLETSTDKDGHFELKLEAGSYNLIISYIGYNQFTRKISLTKDQQLNLETVLKATNTMDEVAVVSSRKPGKISEIPGTVWIIDNARLQEQIKGGVSLKEALGKLIPGLDAGSEGRSSFGQNLRGRNVLVMIDGVSLNSTRANARQFDSVDPFNIERIEVLSGASSLYGGGATGGIINIITKKGQEGPLAFTSEAGVRSGLQQKSDHDVRFAQSISGGSDNFKGRIGIAYQKNNAAFDATNKQIFTDITQTDLQYNQSFDIFANTEFKLTPKQTLKVNAQYYNSGYTGTRDLFLGTNYSIFTPGTNPNVLEMRDGFTSSVKPQSSRASINADYHAADILGGQDLYIQVSSRNEKFSFHPFPAQVRDNIVKSNQFLYNGSTVQSTRYSALKLVLAKQWSAFNLTYGVDADNEKFNGDQTMFDLPSSFASGGLTNNGIATVPRYPGVNINSLSGFMQAQWNLTTRLTLSGGIRQQRMYVNVGDIVGINAQASIVYGRGKTATPIPGGKSHYDVNLLNGGLVYKISAPEQIWVNFAQGFNLADPAKYYGQGTYKLNGTHWDLVQGTSVANSPLTGLKTNQLETGWRHRSKIINAQVAAFYTWSDKDMQTDLTTFSVQVIDRKQRNFGAEGSLSVNLSNGFEIGGNGLYIKSQFKQDNSWKLQTIGNISTSKAVAFVGWNSKIIGFKAQVFRSFDTKDYLDNKFKGYTTLDLLGNVKLPLGRLSFGVQNLLNKEYQTIWSQRAQFLYKGLGDPALYYYNGRGRTYNLTYTINY
ncbi:iron complex outermembrane receptor protein [Pedobacter cryoconitis]|uniref:Ferric aerobactin receptor n=1 Tax=Pedobacter cryoconitis TaxID=188932 RepID=A0A7W9E0Y1_9SPHI|nr:TonB-dependent receptor [Pedobacter cryoconitis]MBB5637794.1 iron complex outermembrane receptor protein [Pedobacter cryoconitis]